jgi:hypothetical protein
VPHIEVEAGVKFAPLMVNVKAAPPAIADAGVRLVIAAVSATVAGAKLIFYSSTPLSGCKLLIPLKTISYFSET